MTTWEDHFKSALKVLLERNGCDVDEVLDWEEDTYTDGYCETCRYTQVVVDIDYYSTQGIRLTYQHKGNFADLIRELGDAEL